MYWEIAAIGVVVILFAFFIYIENKDVKYATIYVGDEKLKAEIADTMIKKSKGLMYRNTIGTDAMIFTAPISGIWMKNMEFPIDIIWTNKTDVIDIAANVPACKTLNCTIYYPKSEADYVIEVPAKWAKENQIKVGVKVKIPDNL